MINSKIKFAGGVFAIGIVGAAMYIGSAGQGYTPGVSMPVGCNGGDSPQWDGAAWQCRTPNDYRSPSLDYTEEFMQVSATSGAIIGQLLEVFVGTGATAANLTVAGRPGVAQFVTGTTTTGSARVQTGIPALTSLTQATVEITEGWPTLSNATDAYEDVIGLWGVVSVNQTDGCYFLLDSQNVATGGQNTGQSASVIQAVSASGGTRTIVPLDGASHSGVTTVNVPIAALSFPNTNIMNLSVVATSTQCVFKSSGVVVATLTTNIPSAALVAGFLHVKSAGTTSREVDVDRIHVHLDFPPRS